VKEFKMVSHMLLEKEGIMLASGILECPEHILHGREVFRQINTPRLGPPGEMGEWGKGVAIFWIEDGTKEPPIFDNTEKMAAHYNLPNFKKEKR